MEILPPDIAEFTATHLRVRDGLRKRIAERLPILDKHEPVTYAILGSGSCSTIIGVRKHLDGSLYWFGAIGGTVEEMMMALEKANKVGPMPYMIVSSGDFDESPQN